MTTDAQAYGLAQQMPNREHPATGAKSPKKSALRRLDSARRLFPDRRPRWFGALRSNTWQWPTAPLIWGSARRVVTVNTVNNGIRVTRVTDVGHEWAGSRNKMGRTDEARRGAAGVASVVRRASTMGRARPTSTQGRGRGPSASARGRRHINRGRRRINAVAIDRIPPTRQRGAPLG